MFKGFVSTVTNLGKSLDKPVFLKEGDSTKTLVQEMMKIKENCDDQGVVDRIEQDIRLIEYGESCEKCSRAVIGGYR